MLGSRTLPLVLVLAISLGVGLVVYRESPRFALEGGAHAAPAEILLPIGDCPRLDQATQLVYVGDSNIAGSGLPSRELRFADQLGLILGKPQDIAVAAAGGARANDPRLSIANETEPGLVVVMLGTNDAAVRGWMRPGVSPTPLDRFQSDLHRRIQVWQRRGAAVLVLAPPPGGSPAINARLSAYRTAARDTAQEAGAVFRDPAEALLERREAAGALQTDGLHLSENGHAAIAKWLAQCIMMS